MATSDHDVAGVIYGALTLLDTDGSHLWTYTQNFGSGTYYQWQNIEYNGAESKGCICGQMSDGLGLVMIYFLYTSTSLLQTTSFFYTSTSPKKCAGLYIDSTVLSAQMLVYDSGTSLTSIMSVDNL